MPRKLFLGIASGLMVLLATGCIVSFEPETAINPIGTEHTVNVELRDPEDIDQEAFCEIILDALEEVAEEAGEEVPFDPSECAINEAADIAEYVHFDVISGPNLGTNSVDDGVCEPLCTELPKDRRYSWTYESNGVPGTDIIQVCAEEAMTIPTDPSFVSAALTEEELFELFLQLVLDGINDELGTDYETIFDLECQTVEKRWVDRQSNDRPNIGAGLSGLFQGQPTALPTAPAPVAAAPNQGIRPPNTGDAGLK